MMNLSSSNRKDLIGLESIAVSTALVLASKTLEKVVAPGDLIRVLQDDTRWWLAQKPEVESGFVALDPNTEPIRAMIGGFNYFESKFNRATQGGRLVGSGIKPLVYTPLLNQA